MTNKQPQYDENFKKNIMTLHQNGKTQTELSKEYGISVSAISRWIKLYSVVKVDYLAFINIRIFQRTNFNALWNYKLCHRSISECILTDISEIFGKRYLAERKQIRECIVRYSLGTFDFQ